MLEINKDMLIKYLQQISSEKVCEVVVHTIFKRFGKERDIDKEVVDNNELEIEAETKTETT